MSLVKSNQIYKEFQNKKIYIYPLTPMSIAFSNFLKLFDIKILGFIDQSSEKAIRINEILEHDYIFIFSFHHEKEIYNTCIKYTKPSKIYCVFLDKKNNYVLSKKPVWKKSFISTEVIQYAKKNIANQTQFKNEILFIGMQFIDLNLKYLYFYFLKNLNYDVYIATASKRDYEMFKLAGFNNVFWCDSIEFVDIALRAKVKIIDQTPTISFFIDLLKIGHCVQLWHGLAIEQIGILANYKVINYDIFISTSPFCTEYSWSKAYDYKKVIHSGYPRNDILWQDDIKLFNVDEELLQAMKNSNARHVIYAPTHRAHGFSKNPINYDILDKFGRDNNIKFIIKLHPYTAEKLRDDLSSHKMHAKQIKNVIIYPPHMDAYPIMKYCDLMIADYSSMYFDFLFVDKPIVFFPYDYDEWVRSEGGVILDYFAHSPGDKAYDFDELLELILKNLEQDMYKNERKKIKDKMFSNQTTSASKSIADEMKKEFSL